MRLPKGSSTYRRRTPGRSTSHFQLAPGGVSPLGSPTNSRCQAAWGHPSIRRAWPPWLRSRSGTAPPSRALRPKTVRLGRGRHWGGLRVAGLMGFGCVLPASLRPEPCTLHRNLSLMRKAIPVPRPALMQLGPPAPAKRPMLRPSTAMCSVSPCCPSPNRSHLGAGGGSCAGTSRCIWASRTASGPPGRHTRPCALTASTRPGEEAGGARRRAGCQWVRRGGSSSSVTSDSDEETGDSERRSGEEGASEPVGERGGLPGVRRRNGGDETAEAGRRAGGAALWRLEGSERPEVSTRRSAARRGAADRHPSRPSGIASWTRSPQHDSGAGLQADQRLSGRWIEWH